MKSKGLYQDFFLHLDILVLSLIMLGMAFFVVASGISWLAVLCFLLGLVAFMFSEYFTHRFLFHLKVPKNPLFLKFLKRLHYDHHKFPDDLKLLFLPIWYSIPSLFVLSALFYFITGSILISLPFAGGLVCMLLVYEWKHYVAHRPIKPNSRFGKWLKKTHTLHHYKNENYWYGVSNPFVDALFGTLKDEKRVEMSQTARDLEKRA
ncbi:sterol desaturase family protein [Fictibacillus sp. KU28468]|uniref:sterol desaturase family protein n=1 Tax=Fictibacillus sp. KU28468 TaxID=2991053 RepID=UPI00223D589F|nr:sterol desaturase family protein [Fictibacillus sp. KU28468]UZJ81177.1 sterol desaturase family protein [Fictibacillus sp. KU28468]